MKKEMKNDYPSNEDSHKQKHLDKFDLVNIFLAVLALVNSIIAIIYVLK